MSRRKPPGEGIASIPPFGLRMPAELRAMVEKAAAHNDRSMNSEIIDRLYGSFQGPRGTDTLVLDPKQARVWADELRKFADHSIPLGKGVTIHLTIDDMEAAREEAAERTKPKPD